MDYGDYYWKIYRDYYRDPFPHSLLSLSGRAGKMTRRAEPLNPKRF